MVNVEENNVVHLGVGFELKANVTECVYQVLL